MTASSASMLTRMSETPTFFPMMFEKPLSSSHNHVAIMSNDSYP